MLVHLAATMDNWDPKFIDLVSEKQHIILIDLPGVGGSEGKVVTTIPGMAQHAWPYLAGTLKAHGLSALKPRRK